MGAIGGLFVVTALANCEPWSFYTVRRIITGKNAMGEIVQHPVDPFISPFLLVLFTLAGLTVGFALGRRKLKTNQLKARDLDMTDNQGGKIEERKKY